MLACLRVVAVILGVWLGSGVREARADFLGRPLPDSSFYEIGWVQIDGGIGFGPDAGASGQGLRVRERNGVFSKALVLLAGGLLIAVTSPSPSGEVITSISRSNRTVYESDPYTKESREVSEETWRVTSREKTAEERAAAERSIEEASGAVGLFASLPLSTEVVLLPDRDDGSLHGGSFDLTVGFGGPRLWFDVGVGGDRYAATIVDAATGMATPRRYRNVTIPLRVTFAPASWFQAEAELRPNLLALDDGDSTVDHGLLWRAGVMVGLPYFDYVYARAGVQRSAILADRPLGTYLELGARF